ncbi:hypothetical protein I3760_12G020700 [Carya illinoinensis]|nr:hypothetical protein I3760_12G020700 [Carya illinoinensis]
MSKAYVHTISGSSNLIEGSERAYIVLPNDIKFCIDDALFSSRFRRNLLSFKDIRRNGCHIETINEDNKEYLLITKIISTQKLVLEKLSALSFGLYYKEMRTIESHVIMHQKYLKPLTWDMFKACFEDCHFDESIFSTLGNEKSVLEARQEIT